MGYQTFVIINVEAFDAYIEKTSDASKVFRDIMEKAGCFQSQINDDSAEFEDNNANTLGAIVELTKDHPGLILQGTIDGTSEDRYDNRAFRIRAGCIEEVTAQVTYPEFTTILTDEEKETRAKAHSDSTKEKANGKELLKVTNLKGSICQTEVDATTDQEKQMVSASLLSLMDQDQEFAKLFLEVTALYVVRRKDVGLINKLAMRQAEIKTKN